MNITAIIVDDELIARQILKSIIDNMSYDVDVIAMAKNVNEAEDLIRKHNPDLVFLDVEMPVHNGFELLTRFENIDFEVVFTTAYEEYAARAFRASCIDYLVKPINPEELSEAIARYKERSLLEDFKQRHSLFNEMVNQPGTLNDKFGISTKSGFHVLDYTDVVYIKSCTNNIEIHNIDGEVIISSKRLKDIEELCEGKFYRSHRSYLINLKYCKQYIRSDEMIQMTNDSFVPLASRSKKEFIRLMRK